VKKTPGKIKKCGTSSPNTLQRPTYVIRNYAAVFEKAQTRKVLGRASWIAIPNRHDTGGYRRVIGLPGGLEIYGAWVLLVQVGSKCVVRGTLANTDGPYDSDDLSAMTGAPAEAIRNAIKVVSDPKVGWLDVIEWDTLVARSHDTTSTHPADSQHAPTLPPSYSSDVSLQNRTGQDNTGQYGVLTEQRGVQGGNGRFRVTQADVSSPSPGGGVTPRTPPPRGRSRLQDFPLGGDDPDSAR